MGKNKNDQKNLYVKGTEFHKRPILTLKNGKCDCHTENPYSERDLIELEWLFRK
jgi:hypothetical protein